MSRRHHRAEDVINKLREAEVGLANGLTVPEVCRKLGVTEQTHYRWRREYGGLTRDQAKRFPFAHYEVLVIDRLGTSITEAAPPGPS